jgi:hypothetical protein
MFFDSFYITFDGGVLPVSVTPALGFALQPLENTAPSISVIPAPTKPPK